MRHRIYNLNGSQTFLGIEMSDIMIGMITWLIGNFLYQQILPGRLAVLATVATITLIVMAWRLFKDKLPPGFFRHLIPWATEANIYRIGLDRTHRPAVVDHRKVLDLLDAERTQRKVFNTPSENNLHLRPALRHGVLNPTRTQEPTDS